MSFCAAGVLLEPAGKGTGTAFGIGVMVKTAFANCSSGLCWYVPDIMQGISTPLCVRARKASARADEQQ